MPPTAQPKKRSLSLVLLCVLIGCLALDSIQTRRCAISHQSIRKSRANSSLIAALKDSCQAFKKDTGHFPASLNDLMTNSMIAGWDGPYLEKLPKDPWNGVYSYLVKGDTLDIQATGRPPPSPWWKRIW